MNRLVKCNNKGKDGHMGIFRSKRIKLEKVNNEGKDLYFIDYYKLNEPEGFLINFIQDYSENKNSLLVVDADNFYVKKHKEADNKINELKTILDNHRIPFKEVVSKKEVDNKIFGIKVQNSIKVNTSKIGLTASADQLSNVSNLIKDYSVFYYIAFDNMDSETLINQFLDTRGNYDELSELYESDIFNDAYFRRMRICSKNEIQPKLEAIIQKYQS